MKLQEMIDAKLIDNEMTVREVLQELIEENERLEQAYHDLANEMVYEGNSIQWIHSKAKNYSNALGEAWKALRDKGVVADGHTTVADGIMQLPSKGEGT